MDERVPSPSGASGAWPLLLAALLALPWGCSAPGKGNPFTGSIGEMFEPLFKRTPSQLARDAFDGGDPDRRRRAIAMLSSADWGGEEVYVRTYRMAAEGDDDESVRAAALNALGRHGTPDDVPVIVANLEHANAFVRLEAAIALQRIHGPDAVDPLIAAMANDVDADVRMAAARALGQYAEPAVFDALVGALRDNHYGVVHHAHQSLELLTGAGLGLATRQWLHWGKAHAEHLFDNRGAYVWHPYQRPRGLLDKAQFWKRQEPVPPRPPTGLAATATQPS